MAYELYTQPFPLVDVTVIDDNELVNHRKVAVMELAMKHKYLRDKFDTIIPLLAQAMDQQYNSDNDIVTMLNYLFITLDSPNFEHIVQQLSEQAERHKEAIMNIAQRLQDKGEKIGWEKGREEGREEGMREAKITMARNLLKNGVSLDLIVESTGLSREELISLQ